MQNKNFREVLRDGIEEDLTDASRSAKSLYEDRLLPAAKVIGFVGKAVFSAAYIVAGPLSPVSWDTYNQFKKGKKSEYDTTQTMSLNEVVTIVRTVLGIATALAGPDVLKFIGLDIDPELSVNMRMYAVAFTAYAGIDGALTHWINRGVSKKVN